ncbi:P44/Msp2 family outer membrane protein [Wolbachia endosymbiont of Brugia malayi]|uniref:P44/Msp2 family outer membrane protein n=1 Tax=Wolbachia endosymbiont of Brugia malayi TaxID=80849 RepID=UPI00004C9275|nr:P44/Msp2 family outer membrane protein [Wolbachia endosymbiont of Brugia malayi]AAW70692.1 Outer surface protein Wsp [Wolbachia endosymbiont strain TRS of Brugia malayi]QCB61672.1 P44/Msp2 family outer membrane protein [Wolbachia endosymbiont of Brugia malayi]
MMKRSIVFDALLILCISFFPIHANESCSNDGQFVENLMLADESTCHKSRKYNGREVISVKDKKLDFYVSANSGKIYSDNSETFVNGIKAIGERVPTLVESRYGTIIKNMVADEIESVKKFDDEIDFQWLNSISLGYYAGENGRIDFETMYSKVNIKNGNSFPIFDRSAGIFAFLLNFYYNPSIQDTQIAPYVGLGIGPTVFRLRKINGSPQNSMPLNVPWFAYQVKLGVSYSIIPEIKTFLGYRYFSIPIPIADDISTHNIEIGLIFNF